MLCGAAVTVVDVTNGCLSLSCKRRIMCVYKIKITNLSVFTEATTHFLLLVKTKMGMGEPNRCGWIDFSVVYI